MQTRSPEGAAVTVDARRLDGWPHYMSALCVDILSRYMGGEPGFRCLTIGLRPKARGRSGPKILGWGLAPSASSSSSPFYPFGVKVVILAF